MEEWMEEWSRQIICLPATFLAWLRGDARRHLGASCLSGCEPLVSDRKGKYVALGGRMLVAFINFQVVVHKHHSVDTNKPNVREGFF